jgi:hypothetical protein
MDRTSIATTCFIAFIGLIAAPGCGASEAAFEPTENVRAAGHEGQPAAAYEVRTASGRMAHVNVWSQGVYRDQRDRTVAHLTLDVRNVGEEPIRLGRDLLRLEAFARSGAPLAPAELISMRSERGAAEDVIPPATAATIDVWFGLPPGTRPDRLGSLRLRWGLGFDGDRRYVQFTEFQRVRPATYASAGVVYYSPVYGFYDPFLYGRPIVYYRYHVPVRRVIVRPRGRETRDHRTR